MPPRKDLDTLHRDIPKDTNGDPIFFILPDDMRASYERKLRQCELGWQATDDPAFVIEAEILRHLHRQVSPLWLAEANIALNAKRRTKGHAKRAIENSIRWIRYDTLRTAKEHGLHWLQHQAEAATGRAIKEKKRADELAGDVKAKDEKAKAERAAEAAAKHAKEAQRRAGKIERRGWVTWPEAENAAVECFADASGGRVRDDQKKLRSGEGRPWGWPRCDVLDQEAAAHNLDRGASELATRVGYEPRAMP